jgi:flagellar protein FliS
MPVNRYQDHLEDEILTANPVHLIQMLYRAALDSITSARRYLKLGDIRARSRAISKAMAIVTELSLSLNHPAGGDVSKNLDELYGYVQTLLIQANVEQSDPPLAEVERLLSTLMEAWQSEKQAGDRGIGAGQGIASAPVGVTPGR